MHRGTFLSASAGFVCVPFVAAEAALAPRYAIVTAADPAITPIDTNRFQARLGHGILEHPANQLVTRDRLDAVLHEQGLSNSAYADPTTAAKLGKIVGASLILYVTLGIDVDKSSGFVDKENYDATSNYEVIEVSTSRILAQGTAEGQSDRRAPGGGDFTDSASRTRRSAIDACADDVIDQMGLK